MVCSVVELSSYMGLPTDTRAGNGIRWIRSANNGRRLFHKRIDNRTKDNRRGTWAIHFNYTLNKCLWFNSTELNPGWRHWYSCADNNTVFGLLFQGLVTVVFAHCCLLCLGQLKLKWFANMSEYLTHFKTRSIKHWINLSTTFTRGCCGWVVVAGGCWVVDAGRVRFSFVAVVRCVLMLLLLLRSMMRSQILTNSRELWKENDCPNLDLLSEYSAPSPSTRLSCPCADHDAMPGGGVGASGVLLLLILWFAVQQNNAHKYVPE